MCLPKTSFWYFSTFESYIPWVESNTDISQDILLQEKDKQHYLLPKI